jgi:hypothetical protein
MVEPDFVSTWYDMKAGTNTTLLSIEHGLGETPLLVDVQVRGGDSFAFPGSGNKDLLYCDFLITEIHNRTISLKQNKF